MTDQLTPAGQGAPATADEHDDTVHSIDLVAAHQSGDHVLAMYVAAFNESPGAEMPLTVFTGGFAFSGRLVGAPVYFERVAALVDDRAISIPFLQMAEDYRTDTGDEKQLVTTYLHMLDVRVLSGGSQVAKLKAWRGRLSQISGWTTEPLARPKPVKAAKVDKAARVVKPDDVVKVAKAVKATKSAKTGKDPRKSAS